MKRILYIIDDVNYNSGAKVVTLLQMKMLMKEYDIYVLSLTEPKETINFLDKEHILDSSIWKITEIYAVSLKKVLKDRNYTLLQKISRGLYAFSLRCGLGNLYFERLIKKRIQPQMETFDTVIVVSEASKLRRLVSKLKYPRKIQWIHTDYARWSEFSEWSKAITRYDTRIYPKFDKIVVLSNYCKQGIVEKIPSIADKISVIPNLIDGDRVLRRSREKSPVLIRDDCLNLVTVARIDYEKRIDKVLELAHALKQKKIVFKWYIIGDGPQKLELENKSRETGINNQVQFLGHLENPYSVMTQCDALVLLSRYEGTPVTIDEAMVLGIGIVAPQIGGIREQIEGYENSYLFETYDNLLSKFLEFSERIEVIDYHKQNLQRLAVLKDVL